MKVFKLLDFYSKDNHIGKIQNIKINADCMKKKIMKIHQKLGYAIIGFEDTLPDGDFAFITTPNNIINAKGTAQIANADNNIIGLCVICVTFS